MSGAKTFQVYSLSNFLIYHEVKVKVLVAQLCQILCDPMECSPPGSSVHRILQARILEWAAIPISRGYSHPGIQPGLPALQADSLPSESPQKSYIYTHTYTHTHIYV